MAHWGNAIACLLVTVICITTATIFPEEDMGYRHYAKREISSDCLRCARTYNYIPCLRCWNSKYAVIPFHSKRSSYDSDLVETGSDIMSRDRRFTGCNCCFGSRFSNSYCCEVCNTARKRMGKRDSDDTSMTSDVQKRFSPDCSCCAMAMDHSSPCCIRCYHRYAF